MGTARWGIGVLGLVSACSSTGAQGPPLSLPPGAAERRLEEGRELGLPSGGAAGDVAGQADRDLQLTVEGALETDPDVGAALVTVAVYRGRVLLSGTVGTLQAQERALQLAQETPGVESVTDHMVLSRPSVTDADLRAEVQSRLQVALGGGGQHTRVEVSRGQVTLVGTVGSVAERQELEVTAKRIPGVRAVRNQIDILAPPRPDALLGPDVESSLRHVPGLLPGQVRARVDRGRVLLEGTVEDATQRQQVRDAVERVPGVQSVEDGALGGPPRD